MPDEPAQPESRGPDPYSFIARLELLAEQYWNPGIAADVRDSIVAVLRRNRESYLNDRTLEILWHIEEDVARSVQALQEQDPMILRKTRMAASTSPDLSVRLPAA